MSQKCNENPLEKNKEVLYNKFMKTKRKTINQILVTDKVIVTPEFKKKRKLYKFNFFLFSFLACTLCSCCIYAEYDRNKSEEVSQEILAGIEIESNDNTTISIEDDVVVVKALADGEATEKEVDVTNLKTNNDKPATKVTESVAPDGKTYYTEAILKIPSLGIEYPVLSDTSEELLKKSLNRLWGPKPNEVGNYVIAGHNYKGGRMFGKLPSISIGAIVEITDLSGRTVQYKVYKKYNVDPTDVSCTSQRTNGKKEITMVTCTSTGKERVVVKAEAI